LEYVERKLLFDTYNAAYAQAVFDRYLQNPGSVDPAWRAILERDGSGGGLLGTVAGNGAPRTEAYLIAARAAGELVDAFRLHGHRAARLDPLGSSPPGHPQLDPGFHGITSPELERVPASMVGLASFGETIADVIQRLRTIYTGTIGYEFEYLEDPEKREWLREHIEAGVHREPLQPDERRRLLARLTEVEVFEQFLHRAYLGAKRFSIEGTDMLVPMLDLSIERAAAAGATGVVIGMAHRGRLNVLAHVIGGVSYADIIAKFEGRHARIAGTGDVKYHLGAEGVRATRSGTPLTITLAPNPSHLEFVNPVVEGMARARQTDRTHPVLTRDENLVVPVLIHGDAAFSGQGVVAETLNLARLLAYRTGGTLHIIANNQIGFTTDPRESRSADYASDLARGFDVPVFHVNADDPEACLAVIHLAMSFRERFHDDVVIDLIGYRRYGHNEGDEPAYTQPVMYREIAAHPTVLGLWTAKLVDAGVVDSDAAQALRDQAHAELVDTQEQVRSRSEPADRIDPDIAAGDLAVDEVPTAVDATVLASLDRQIHAWPDDVRVLPKLARQLERRARLFAADRPIDWAHAEALALASLLAGGVPIRVSGQDTERGTFSQRHLVLHDAETAERYIPLAHLEGLTVPFEICNSPLSELAALGFEYGYSVVAPRALVLWEAQFGDFVNGAQVILDQFLAAGREKWGQLSRLVLLLPHGFEGQGPEHSSARLERFLQSCAEDNLRVANCTTPAQYFHLLRWQALNPVRRPLIVMTPKSLLRNPHAVSRPTDLSADGFHAVIGDTGTEPTRVERVALCSGKIYYDLMAVDAAARDRVACIRVERLYPLPARQLASALAPYAGAEIAWVQEEPRNMGAWSWIEPQLRELTGRDIRYIGRPGRASTAEGYAVDHEAQQNRIVNEVFESGPERARRQRSKQGGV
jgi:2-oxoglutarate dehydrogenase E1 component